MSDFFGFKKSYAKKDLIDLIYPVGSYYLNATDSDPSVIFGGQWVKILFADHNHILFSSSANKPIGTIGGSGSTTYTPSGSVSSTTLTESQLPEHSHDYNRIADGRFLENAINTEDTTLTDSQLPLHTHTLKITRSEDSVESGSHPYTMLRFRSGLADSYAYYKDDCLDESSIYGSQHNHQINLLTKNSSSIGSSQGHTHSFIGQEMDIPINTKCFYVNLWKRVE